MGGKGVQETIWQTNKQINFKLTLQNTLITENDRQIKNANVASKNAHAVYFNTKKTVLVVKLIYDLRS